MGGPQCRLSILRNGNVPCRYFLNFTVDFKIVPCPLSILRKVNVPCHYFLFLSVDFKRVQCHLSNFKKGCVALSNLRVKGHNNVRRLAEIRILDNGGRGLIVTIYIRRNLRNLTSNEGNVVVCVWKPIFLNRNALPLKPSIVSGEHVQTRLFRFWPAVFLLSLNHSVSVAGEYNSFLGIHAFSVTINISGP